MAASSRALFLACLAFVVLSVEAGEVLVGGKPDAWKLGSDSLTKWAQNARFRIGDSLVWKHDGSKDSVLQVSQADYSRCNTTSPIEEYSYNKEDIKVKLERSGPFFFISGVKGQCDKGQKLRIVVVSPRHSSFSSPSPAPAPVGVDGPAVAPTSGAGRSSAALMVAAMAFGAVLAFMST